MSYSRFTSDNWRSDVYVYMSDAKYIVHVASKKYPDSIIEMLLKLGDTNKASGVDEFLEIMEKQRELLKQLSPQSVPIGGPFDGRSMTYRTPQELLEGLNQLKVHGYHVPNEVFVRVEEDVAHEERYQKSVHRDDEPVLRHAYFVASQHLPHLLAVSQSPLSKYHLRSALWHLRYARAHDVEGYTRPEEPHPGTLDAPVYDKSTAVAKDADTTEVSYPITCPSCMTTVPRNVFFEHHANCHVIKCPHCASVWNGMQLAKMLKISPVHLTVSLNLDGCPNCEDTVEVADHVKVIIEAISEWHHVEQKQAKLLTKLKAQVDRAHLRIDSLHELLELTAGNDDDNDNDKGSGDLDYTECPLCHSQWFLGKLEELYPGKNPEQIEDTLRQDGCPSCEVK